MYFIRFECRNVYCFMPVFYSIFYSVILSFSCLISITMRCALIISHQPTRNSEIIQIRKSQSQRSTNHKRTINYMQYNEKLSNNVFQNDFFGFDLQSSESRTALRAPCQTDFGTEGPNYFGRNQISPEWIYLESWVCGKEV